MPKRRPAVAGYFYESSAEGLRRQIERCFTSKNGPGALPSKGGSEPPVTLISPHAGYMYSGPVAAHGFALASRMPVPETVVVVGPNHHGEGTEVSIYPPGSWVTPLGEVEIDAELSNRLIEESDLISMDEISHIYEHSIEVQLPFLQYIYGRVKFVPICMLNQSIEAAQHVGEVLAKTIDRSEKCLVVASSDFTHYEPHDEAVRRDMPVIERILKLDVEGFYTEMRDRRATLCGYGAIGALIWYARLKGYTEARLLKYATSGDTSGDKSSVVGYASIAFLRR
ncbi:MAG: AmmeMemoRadiSam system protein B [Aigarchaeota archaeon]|nr:AmmeMemoRadiSam system protein B [Candidatus Calditenuaceae archaeon]